MYCSTLSFSTAIWTTPHFLINQNTINHATLTCCPNTDIFQGLATDYIYY
jgi:hypothetical protein